MDFYSKVNELLADHNVINLAYLDQVGDIQSCALWYAHNPEDHSIIVLSSLSTRHGSSLKQGGKIAFTINEDKQDWNMIKGLQGRGTIKLIEDDGGEWNTYTKKYEFVNRQFPDIETALEKTRIWMITPTWLRIIDNSISFGYKEERSLV